MILKASQRGHAKELAHHLLNGDTNEHVTVHDIRGFVSGNIIGAFEEVQAVSLGTKCKQFLFSLSLNPPVEENATIADFEDAIEKAENQLGLNDQPRIIVFHEKRGRRHCHCVWSRIKTDCMTAINMSHFKRKLNDLAKSLYLKHGWALPKGFKGEPKPAPENYALPEWQQSERLRKSPEALRAFFQSCWQNSDTKTAFAGALQEYGFYLARGDRRGYVAVDVQGEVYSLSRWAKIKTRELKDRLGDPATLPTVLDAQQYLETRLTGNIKQHMRAQQDYAREQRAPLVKELRDLVKQQRKERDRLLERQQKRWQYEQQNRQKRLSTGMQGIWERMTGQYQTIRSQNETETKSAQSRDRTEMHGLIQKHLQESKELHKTLQFYKQQEQRQQYHLQKHIAGFINTASEPPAKSTSEPIEERLQTIEIKLTTIGNDITDLQGALGQANLSDELKAKIRILIERAKETLHIQQTQKAEEQRQKAEKAEAEKLQILQKRFYMLLQHQEKLKAELQQREANRSFYKAILMMPQSLNGIPLHEIKLAPPPPFNENKYRTHLRQKSNSEIKRDIKTKPPKRNDFDSTELRKSVLTVKEALHRGGYKISQKTPLELNGLSISTAFKPTLTI